MSSARRGQTLVMMSLTVLLLVLMVMMTISIGSKIKEKMELQTLSDSAAYSQAVVTARTFNALSTMNRIGVAHVVGTLAVQSLLSWSTYIFANMTTSQQQYRRWNNVARFLARVCCFPRSPCDSACPGCRFARTQTGIQNSILTGYINGVVRPYFMAMDLQVWLEALAYLTSADFVHLAGSLPTYYFMSDFLSGQSGVSTLVNRARAGTPNAGELYANGSPDGVNFDEVMPLGGAMYPINPVWHHHAFAANGSRLHPFLTNRTAASALVTLRLLSPPWQAAQAAFVQVGRGSGYVTRPPGPQHGSNMLQALFGAHFSADDHSQGGLLGGYFGDGFSCWPLWNRVQRNTTTAHVWGNMAMGQHRGTNFNCPYLHNVGGLGRGYPWFMDYNFVLLGSQDNVWGQPKNFGVVYRDLSTRPSGGADQWNPFFRFRFSAASGGNFRYDQRGIVTKSGSDIGRQVGFSTGITYYHRGNNLFGYHSGAEPPNLFNPYWRAGLTRWTVDDPRAGGGDVRRALGGHGAAIDAFNGLQSAGFKGWQ